MPKKAKSEGQAVSTAREALYLLRKARQDTGRAQEARARYEALNEVKKDARKRTDEKLQEAKSITKEAIFEPGSMVRIQEARGFDPTIRGKVLEITEKKKSASSGIQRMVITGASKRMRSPSAERNGSFAVQFSQQRSADKNVVRGTDGVFREKK